MSALGDRLGPVGVWMFGAAFGPEPGAAAARIERAGYEVLWVGGGSTDPAAFDRLEEALARTNRLVLATGITNIWAWEPDALAERVTALERAYPGRFVLGLGVSHAPLVEKLGRHYERPFSAMVEFLDRWESHPERHGPAPVVLAALGERMLGVARDRTAGAHPYLTPPEHTRFARGVLGSGPLLAPEQTLVLDEDEDVARSTAREFIEHYLRLPNYKANLRRLGFDSDDLEGAGSDRLIDAIVLHGDAAHVAAGVRAHLAAGADHVCIQPRAHDGGIDFDALDVLAPLLLG